MLLFSHPFVSNSLQPHGLQHSRPLCPSPSPEVGLSSCPLHQWCHQAISSSDALLLPSTFPSIRDFSKDLVVCITWPKYWSFSISPSNEYSGLISLKINWFDLLAVQGTLRTLSSTAIRRHQFFNALPSSWSSSYNPTWPLGKTMALTMQTFVSRVISLLFKTLSRFVIAFLPRNKHLLISCLQSPSAVILEPKRGNLSLLLRFPPLYLPRSNGARCHDLSFFNI